MFVVSVVSAHVVGEDEAVMKAASAKDLVLKIWHTKDGPVSDKPPPRVRWFRRFLLYTFCVGSFPSGSTFTDDAFMTY